MTKKMKVGIIFGGKSGEHDVSLMSAASVINAIDKEKYDIFCIGITKQGEWLVYEGDTENIENGTWEDIARRLLDNNPEKYELSVAGTRSIKDKADIIFPILHGPYGEDGTMQGLLEISDIPYVGAGVMGSALAMDKAYSKLIFEKENLPICDYKIIYRKDIKKNIDDVIKSIEEKFNYPLFVKPANLGSSVGISKAHDNKELIEALMEACKYDRKIVIEEYVPCREIEVGVIGNDEPMASAVGEIIASKEFYDYEAKYLDGGKSEIRIPADITESQKNRIRNMAINAYKALDCCGFSRVDFFINKETGEILINEINTIPGFTRYSMFPLLWKEAGIEYSKLIDMLIEYGFERYNDRG